MTRTSRSVTSRVPMRLSPRVLLSGAALAGAALLMPSLAGCEAGLDSPTAQFHPVGFGAYQTSNGITVDNAFILGPPPGQQLNAGDQAGMFLTVYSAGGDQLVKASASGASSVRLVNGPVNVPANGTVDLNGPAPQLVLTGLTGGLRGGQTVTVTLTFATAGEITVPVPVEPQADQYATFQPPAPQVSTPATSTTPTPTTTPSTTAKHAKHAKRHHAHHAVSATATATPTPSATASPTPTH